MIRTTKMDLQKILGNWKAIIGIGVLAYAGLAFAADQRYEPKGASAKAVASDWVLDYELRNCDTTPPNCKEWEHAKYKIYKKQLEG